VQTVTAIILGGGRGSRLFPLTQPRSKPAVGFAGKYRLIDIPLSNCINSDVRRIYVLTQFLSASLHRHIMQTYTFDVFTDGFVDILAAEQTAAGSNWFQGTSDAVRATLNHTMYYDSAEMLILSGDHLYRMDYRDLIAFHRDTDADITICVHPVPEQQAPRLGLMRADATGRVSEFVEKPQDPEVIKRFAAPRELFASRDLDLRDDSYLASMGNYVFKPDVLREVLADVDKTDFGKEVIPEAIGQYKVMAFPFTDYWADIGTIGSFYEANLDLARHDPPFSIYQADWPFYTRTRSLPPSRIIGSEIRDCLVVEGADIEGAQIANSIIGMRSNVREGSVLDSVVMLGSDFYEGEHLLGGQATGGQAKAGQVTDGQAVGGQAKAGQAKAGRATGGAIPPMGIGRDCHIVRAIIDKNARIGDGVIIPAQTDVADYEGEHYWVRDGITIIPKGAVIPAGTDIGAPKFRR